MRFLRRSLVGIFLLSLTVGLLAWAGNTFFVAMKTRQEQQANPRPARERVFAANVIAVTPGVITPVLTSFGEVRSQRTLDVRATTGGMIVELAEGFVEGGNVQAGQLIARIDPLDAEATLVLARTDVAEAEAEQRDAARGLELDRDELMSAQDQVRLRELALTRQVDLLARGVGTGPAVENAELAVSSAKQSVLARRQILAKGQARVDQANTALSRREIKLSEAQRSLDDTRIYAGFSGSLTQVSAVQGGLVTNNERLAQIVDAASLEVTFRVSTPQYTRLLDADGGLLLSDVVISLDIFGVDLTTKGTISRESAVVGEGQTGRLLFARIADAKGFRPGDFVTVKISEPALENVVVLPASAVDAKPSVLVVGEEDRLEVVAVQLLRRQGDNVIVRSDALLGKEVVGERSPLLGAGIKIKPIRPGDAQDELVAAASEPEMLELTDERRALLVDFIENNQRMPAEAKERVLGQLRQDQVPVQVVERIESRMGG